MNADNVTVLCREGDVETNDSLHRQFTPSCKVSKASSESCSVSAFSLVPGYKTFTLVQRTIVFHSCLERCPCLSLSNVLQRCCRELVSFSAHVWTYEMRNFLIWQFSFFSCSGRVDSRLVLCDTAFSVFACWALSRTCPFFFHPSLCIAQGG